MKADLVRVSFLAATIVFGSLYLHEHQVRTDLEVKTASLRAKCETPSGEPLLPENVPSQPKSILPSSPHSPSGQVASSARHFDPGLIVDMRISALRKFVPITADQEERLREKYRLEAVPPGESPEKEPESLADIIGDEQAKFFKEQRRAAFEKSENDEIEKDVLLYGRRLGLSSKEEDDLRVAMFDVNRAVKDWEKSQGPAERSPRGMMNRYLERYQFYRSELLSKAKGVLSPEKYGQFVEQESSSSLADVALWHQPSDDSSSEDPIAK